MATKTKHTAADASLALENPAALTGEIMPPEAGDGTSDLSGPDAPEAAVEQGADGVTDTGGEDQAQPSEAAPADLAPAQVITLPMDYRKKPVVIQALEWTGQNLVEVIDFIGKHPSWDEHFKSWDEYQTHVLADRNVVKIITLEGTMEASPGDWIIQGVQGEHYPCKPDIFAATYDPVEADPAPADPAATEATAPVTVEQVDAMLQSLSDIDRETLLAKYGVQTVLGRLSDAREEAKSAAQQDADALANLARLLDEVGARTTGMTGGFVGPGFRRFLEAEGAEISEEDPATVTLGGTTASSQFGLQRALLDWCMLASRKIMAGVA